MKRYAGCCTVHSKYFQANVRTVTERALTFVPVTPSVPFYAAVLQYTHCVFPWLLMKTHGLTLFENVQSTSRELLVDKTFLFAFCNLFTVNSCTSMAFALLSNQDTQTSVVISEAT